MTRARSLTLPVEAATLWRRTHDIVRRGIAEVTGDPCSYAVGGGTILAARWRHRASQDIDIVIAEQSNPGKVLGRPESAFRREIEDLGGEVTPKARGKLVTAGWPGRKVDIWATTPMPRSGATNVIIDDRAETVLSTTQILRGKLERGEDCLSRDVYDLLQSAEFDRASLVAAANAAGRSWTMTVAGIWTAANDKIAGEVERLATSRPLTDASRLGVDAAAALRNALYRKLEIGSDRNRIVVHATTGFGDEEPIVIEGDARDAFERFGLNGYLETQQPGPFTIRRTAEATARRATKYTAVYMETDGRTTRCTDDALNGPPAGQALAQELAEQQRKPGESWKR